MIQFSLQVVSQRERNGIARQVAMDDSAKREGQPTSELFTVILCDPNFAVS